MVSEFIGDKEQEMENEGSLVEAQEESNAEKALQTYFDTITHWISDVEAQKFLRYLKAAHRDNEASKPIYQTVQQFPSQNYLVALKGFVEGSDTDFNQLLSGRLELRMKFAAKNNVLHARAKVAIAMIEEERYRQEHPDEPLKQPDGQAQSETPVLQTYLDGCTSIDQVIKVMECFPQIILMTEDNLKRLPALRETGDIITVLRAIKVLASKPGDKIISRDDPDLDSDMWRVIDTLASENTADDMKLVLIDSLPADYGLRQKVNREGWPSILPDGFFSGQQ